MRVVLLIGIFVVASVCGQMGRTKYPEEYVNTLGGTKSRYDISSGNVLPLVGRPWGFNTWAPMTEKNGGWWFHPDDRVIYGIRCTHQPSPWISDYGQFLIFAGLTDPNHSDGGQYSGYNPLKSTFKPYMFGTSLLAYSGTTYEVTATERAAVLRVKFPKFEEGKLTSGFNQTRRIMVLLNSFSDNASVDEDGTITGSTQANSGGVPIKATQEYLQQLADQRDCLKKHRGSFPDVMSGAKNPCEIPENKRVKDPNAVIYFNHYFHLEIRGGEKGDIPVSSSTKGVANRNGKYAFIDFDPSDVDTDTLIIRVGTSLISPDQAELNLKREIGDRTFDEVLEESRLAWREALSVVDIVDDRGSYGEESLTVFYSALWRSSQFPRKLYEFDAEGNAQHYSPYDAEGRVFPGVLSADSGFWDAYRTVYPQLSLLRPKLLGQIVQGWINGFKEGGWLTKWSSPGYRDSMVGSMGDCALADAIVKGIDGFEVDEAYKAIRKDAFEMPPEVPVGTVQHGAGRVALKSYLDNGYIAAGAVGSTGPVHEVVSRTMNYAVADHCISLAADKLGFNDDAEVLYNRSIRAYHLLFDGTTGFFRSRTTDGSLVEPFDEFGWGGDYTEASPWQYRFYVPYDPKGLKQLYADHGKDICEFLEKTQTEKSYYHVGGYPTVIHEMTEMAVNCWGQYEHNNQPSHHVLYMFIAQGDSVSEQCASRGQYYLRRAMRELYKPTNDMFSGDEDNGEMSSWFLLSSLGLYQLSLASPHFTLGSPYFGHVKVHLESGKTLEIIAENNDVDAVYVHSVSWNGQVIQGTTIAYDTLMEGGVLSFNMSKIAV